MPVILTFGDSNTHGTPPMATLNEYQRFGADIRWPTRAMAALGSNWILVEEGLPGRTAQYDDAVVGPHLNGQLGLKIALQSHGPIDILVIMLGTNDVKAEFGATPEQITGGIAGLLAIAMEPAVQSRHQGFKVLLVCPPPVEEVGPLQAMFYGGAAKSRALPALYAALARAYGAEFMDAGRVVTVSPIDGVHYEDVAHGNLAVAIAEKLAEMA